MTNFQLKVIELAKQGYTVSDVAKLLNCNMTSVSSVKKRFNLTFEQKRKGIDHHDYIDVIDTDRKAYFLGFLIADGCLCKGNKNRERRISFNIQKEDSYILDIFKSEIGVHNHIIYRNVTSGAINRKTQACLRFTSRHMVNVLENKYNILKNKTYNFDFVFPFDTIPDNLKGAFIRGFIDGDGSFESHTFVFTPSIIGTSIKWLNQIGDLIYEKTGLTNKIYTIQGKTYKYYTMRFKADNNNKFEKIERLYHFLYNNETICLKRKKDKIESYLEYRANHQSKKLMTV